MQPRVVLVLAFAIPALALAGCVGGTNQYDLPTEPELEDPNRLDHEAAGERTCLAEARWFLDAPSCPRTPTGRSNPIVGTLVLDQFYVAAAGPSDPDGKLDQATRWNPSDPNAGAADQWAWDVLSGSNTARATGGLLPDVILPGVGTFVAVLGQWDNRDGDSVIQIRFDAGSTEEGGYLYNVSNEWAAADGFSPLSYIEPGSHPSYDRVGRPGPTEPDIRYYFDPSGLVYRPEHEGDVVFLDGSLLLTYEITTVSGAFLTPSEDGRFPFTPAPGALVDIDRYAAVAPSQLVGLYGSTLGPSVTAVGSPSWGTCPNGCSVDGFPSGTALDATFAEAGSALWARATPEWEPASGSSAAGRYDAFAEGYHAWLDLLPRWKIHGANGHVSGFPIADGTAAPGPGVAHGPVTYSFVAWTGVWKDLNGDGRVGAAATPDPYEGGRRPQPDNYAASRGEFFGVYPAVPGWEDLRPRPFNVTFIPDTDWGAGAYLTTLDLLVPAVTGSRDNPSCLGLVNWGNPGCIDPERAAVLGSEPIRLVATAYGPSNPGGYFTFDGVLFPAGSPGFRMCTETLVVVHHATGDAIEEPVWDCDHVPRAGP